MSKKSNTKEKKVKKAKRMTTFEQKVRAETDEKKPPSGGFFISDISPAQRSASATPRKAGDSLAWIR